MNTVRALITIDGVTEKIECCRATVYNMMRQQGFPRPIRIGRRGVRWKSEEIQEWIDSRPRA